MATLYILFSSKVSKYYIGSTEDLERRLHEHNRGQTTWTRVGIPWICVYTERFTTPEGAKQRERQLKKWKSRVRIKELIEYGSAG